MSILLCSKDRVRVYATFVKKDGYTFRHSTYIQFGESDETIGGCILCNPGSSILLDDSNFKVASDDEITGQAKLDDTMKVLKEIIEETHGEGVEGKFYIYNLVTLKDAKMNHAIDTIKNISYLDELLNKDLEDFRKNIKNIPFILLGWGCEVDKNLDRQRKIILDELISGNVEVIGIESKDKSKRKKMYYKHPLPKIPTQREGVKKELISEILLKV